MKILGEYIKRGKDTFVNINVASLYTQTKIEIPIMVESSKLDGPTLLIHGRNSRRRDQRNRDRHGV